MTPLRDLINRHQLFTKKSLGQHFLLDPHLMENIVRAAGDLSGKRVVEIGPGPGGLTRALLASNAKEVIAIEKDERCLGALQELKDAYPDRLTLMEEDALKVDIRTLAPCAIVANLPYNVGTELLLNWLDVIYENPSAISSMTLLFQKEVADRIAAEPRTKAYGRLSVMSQFLCEAECCFDIPPEAFLPPPKVTSTLIHIVPRKTKQNVTKEALEKVLLAAFGQRRKMLRQSLKSLTQNPEALLEKANIKPTCRAEELSVEDFCRLTSLT